MAVGRFFFSAAPTAQNSPELHFHFINYFIQPSRVESLTLWNVHNQMRFFMYSKLAAFFTCFDTNHELFIVFVSVKARHIHQIELLSTSQILKQLALKGY